MSRPREDGIVIGTLEPGPRNSIADVGVTSATSRSSERA